MEQSESFDRGLSDLDRIDLHPAIIEQYSKCDNEKRVLGQVYYEKTKMLKWKESCVKNFSVQQQKIEKLHRQIEVVNEKQAGIDNHLSDMLS